MFISPMGMFWVGSGVGAVAMFAILFILAIIIHK